jgi:hypothetical protein
LTKQGGFSLSMAGSSPGDFLPRESRVVDSGMIFKTNKSCNRAMDSKVQPTKNIFAVTFSSPSRCINPEKNCRAVRS